VLGEFWHGNDKIIAGCSKIYPILF